MSESEDRLYSCGLGPGLLIAVVFTVTYKVTDAITVYLGFNTQDSLVIGLMVAITGVVGVPILILILWIIFR